MRTTVIAALLCLASALGLGLHEQRQAAAPRSNDLTIPASDAWYKSLPSDPKRATAAFLDRIPAGMRERGEQVSRSRYWVLAARIVASIFSLLLFLFSGAAITIEEALSRWSRYRWLQALLFAFTLLTFVLIITMPVEVYAGYARWRRFGFADRPFTEWLGDYLLNWMALAVFYAAGLAVLMAVLRRWPRSWFLWAGLVYLALATIYTAATPGLIEPLTNHYAPLPQSETKSEILEMVRAAGVSADDIYTGNASRQSRMLNAHVSGIFGSARVSVDDTTLASQSLASVKAVVAHELGHYVQWHMVKMVLFQSVVATLGFALIAWAGPLLVQKFGARWRVSRFESVGEIAILWLLFVAWGFVSEPVTNFYTRVQESQADAYGLDLSRAPEGMAEFMIHDADIARLQPTLLDVLLFYDHPSDVSRVENAMRWRAAHSGSVR